MRPTNRPLLSLSLLIVFVFTAGCGAPAANLPKLDNPPPTPNPYVRTVDAITATLGQVYVYSDQIDLAALTSTYKTQAGSFGSTAEFEAMLDDLLAEFPNGSVQRLSRTERIEYETAPSFNDLAGVGAFFSYLAEPEPHLVVLEVLPNSPAQHAGLNDHDRVLAIDGEPINTEEGANSINRLFGEEGTQVTLEVDTPEGYWGDMTITRAAIDPTAERRFIVSFVPGTDILYMRFPRLGHEGLGIDFLAAFQTFALQQQIGSMILDLRIATTGTGWPLDNLLQAFADGEVGSYASIAAQEPLVVAGSNYLNSQTMPLIILVGPDTQGLPEVFSAALQSSGRAAVFGLPTAGDFKVQDNFALPDGSTLQATTLTFIDAQGNYAGLEGVQPDLVIDSYWDSYTSGNDTTLLAAIDVLLRFR